jgi:hypothetical protein
MWEASTYVTPVTVKPPEIATVIADWKAVPVTVNDAVWLCVTTSWPVAVGNVIVGPAFTVKHAGHEPEPPFGFVTVTEREPVEAPDEIVTFADNWLALANEVEFTVIPLPENDTVAPETNPVPVTVIVWLAAPWPREDGFVETTVGAVSVVGETDVPAFPTQFPSFAAMVKV